VEVWQTSNLRWLRLGEGKKEKQKKNKPQHENIYGLPIPQGDHKQNHSKLCIPHTTDENVSSMAEVYRTTYLAGVVALTVVQSFLAGLDEAPGRRAQSVGDDALVLGRVVRRVVRRLPVARRVARVAAASVCM